MIVTTRTQVIGSVITSDVSDATLAAAKGGDRDAQASILEHMATKLGYLASRSANTADGDASEGLRAAYQEDLLQEANVIALERLATYEGDSMDAFRAYVWAYVQKELPAVARDLLNGTQDDTDGKKLFAQMVKHFRTADVRHNLTEGDYLNLAESAVQDKGLVAALNGGAYKSRVRMSAEAAYAARLAYQGSVSIFTPTGGEDDGETTIADALVSADAEADVAAVGYRPIQWTQAVHALEDALTVPRDADAREAVFIALDRFRAGTVTESDLELFEALPCRTADFGTAVAMLRAVHTQRQEAPQASTAEKSADAALGRGSIALTAQRSILEKVTENAVKRALVRRVVATMSQRQAYVLAASFGFMGKFKDDAAVARAMKAAGIGDVGAPMVRMVRRDAQTAFAKRWAALIAKNGTELTALEAAAEKAGVSLEEALTED
ncbi:hypothetical protein [Streptomyces sp. 135]|uniref:hypothetical protein n=1 Tax=Streptomyces sp. 135 TaxID=2838850 RepID=UPI001CBD6F71|nr:hypothetical protein [Streptomyces sp. 135]